MSSSTRRSSLPMSTSVGMMGPCGGIWYRVSFMGGNLYMGVMEDGRQFAVKSMECSEATKEEVGALEEELLIVQRLQECGRIVGCLGSNYSVENCVRIRNVFLENSMCGKSLEDTIRQYDGHLEEGVVRAYTRCIVEALKHMHDRGVVHCDVRAKNVFIDEPQLGSAKVGEFGSAKRMMKRVEGGGSAAAAAEQQMMIEGPASDIWCLGCTILEMANGLTSPHAFASLPHSFSQEATHFLRNCFIPDPNLRWTSAQLLNHPFLNNMQLHNASTPTSISR